MANSILIFLCCLCVLFSQAQTTLVSGTALKNADSKGYGHLSLPFYNGYLMGVAGVSSARQVDLFLQGTNGSVSVIYYYAFNGMAKDGTPIYDKPLEIDAPYNDKDKNRGVVLQHSNGKIYGFWKYGATIRYAEFDKSRFAFSPKGIIKVGGNGYSDFGVIELPDKRILFVAGKREDGVFSNGAGYPHKIAYNSEGFWPYEIPKMGIVGGVMDDFGVTTVDLEHFKDFNQAYYSFDGFVGTTIKERFYILAGSRLGNIYSYEWDGKASRLLAKKNMVDENYLIQRNPNIHAYLGYFKYDENHQGVVTVGEGGIYYYPNACRLDSKGNLIFKEPQHVLQKGADLYAGSLVNPELVDWDGDGQLDLIVGNSMGYIFFYRNKGTNEVPRYGDPIPLEANGNRIHIQPGYSEDIQGPGESRWGYLSPAVFDWDGDGKMDILTGDSRGKFMFYRNVGTPKEPILAAEKTLYLEGMDLYGTWRLKPGVARFGDKVAYTIFDRDDELHLYWQLDAYNLEDGGKLLMGDKPIRGSKYGGGTVGRSKIVVTDWDEDGVSDLLIGTYGKQSIPDTTDVGLPLNMKPKRGSTVLFLKNVGTNERPSYAFPKPLKFRGKYITLGGHECTPAVGAIGNSKKALLVGVESGRVMYYDKNDLSW